MSLTHPLDVQPRPAARETDIATSSYPVLPKLSSPTPAGLARLATVLATRADLWRPLIQVDQENRWFTRIAGGDGWEAWLLTWLPGQRTACTTTAGRPVHSPCSAASSGRKPRTIQRVGSCTPVTCGSSVLNIFTT
jgi:hypothetical protein